MVSNNHILWLQIDILQYSIGYFIVYTISNVVLLTYLSKSKSNVVYIKDIRYIQFRYKIPILIVLMSFAGIPPMAGFFTKYTILLLFLKTNSFFILIIAIACSIISCYYYLRLIKIIVFGTYGRTLYVRILKNNLAYVGVN